MKLEPLQTIYGLFSKQLGYSRLYDLCQQPNGVQTGPFGSQLHQKDYVSEGVPIITVEHLGDNRISHDNLPRVSDEDYKRLSRYKLNVGDIVFSRVGSVDRRAIVREDEDGWLFSGRCLRVCPDRRILDSAYLAYFFGLPAFSDYLRKVAVGATMPSLNTQILSELPIYFPLLEEQKAIARILGSLDDKIELNRRTNATLESLAQTLFRAWFVDFEPVKAKAAGLQPAAMDAETAALFPSEWESSTRGLIPKGWEVGNLDNVANFLNGLALQKYRPTKDEEALPVIKISQLRKGFADGNETSSTRIGEAYIVKNGDVLFSWSGSLEVAIWCGGRGALNQHLFKVTSEKYPKWFYYFWTLHHLESFRGIAADKATTMGHIQRRHLTEAKVLVPQPELLEAMGEIIAPLLNRQISNTLESQTLSQLRDALLPRLISGQLRVPEAMREVEG